MCIRALKEELVWVIDKQLEFISNVMLLLLNTIKPLRN